MKKRYSRSDRLVGRDTIQLRLMPRLAKQNNGFTGVLGTLAGTLKAREV
ncbi:hypothetical protein [Nostoc sp. LPT]|nr:hypothetical protein [Nostoc sp. LPT]